MGLIYCSECGKKVSDKAEKCIYCGAPINKKTENIKKKTSTGSVVLWVLLSIFVGIPILIIIIALLVGIGSSVNSESKIDANQNSLSNYSNIDPSVQDYKNNTLDVDIIDTKEQANEQIITNVIDEKSDTATMGEKNALNKAKEYLNFMAFSRDGLIKQLEYDGFTPDEAVYGVNYYDINWNKQAVLKAESYLNFMAFSRDGLIKQLEYDGFTREQSEYGVQAVGYD